MPWARSRWPCSSDRIAEPLRSMADREEPRGDDRSPCPAAARRRRAVRIGRPALRLEQVRDMPDRIDRDRLRAPQGLDRRNDGMAVGRVLMDDRDPGSTTTDFPLQPEKSRPVARSYAMPVGPSHGDSGQDATTFNVFSSMTCIVLVPSLFTKILPIRHWPRLRAPCPRGPRTRRCRPSSHRSQ